MVLQLLQKTALVEPHLTFGDSQAYTKEYAASHENAPYARSVVFLWCWEAPHKGIW